MSGVISNFSELFNCHLSWEMEFWARLCTLQSKVLLRKVLKRFKSPWRGGLGTGWSCRRWCRGRARCWPRRRPWGHGKACTWPPHWWSGERRTCIRNTRLIIYDLWSFIWENVNHVSDKCLGWSCNFAQTLMGQDLGKNYPLTKARSVQAYDSSSGIIIWFF